MAPFQEFSWCVSLLSFYSDASLCYLLEWYVSLLPFTARRLFSTFHSDTSLHYLLQWYVSLLPFTPFMSRLITTSYASSLYYILQWYVSLRLLTTFYSDTSLNHLLQWYVSLPPFTMMSLLPFTVTRLFTTFHSGTSLCYLLQWYVYLLPFTDSPWCNRNGWLGVKHQVSLHTYLPFTVVRLFMVFYSDTYLYYLLQRYISLLPYPVIRLFITVAFTIIHK